MTPSYHKDGVAGGEANTLAAKCYKECFKIMMQAATAISLDGVIKQFGRFAALRGVTASFEAGKLYVIVGDNGAGKTTLLRVIAGLAHATKGSISVLGTRNVKDARARMGYMAHPSLLYDEMSGIENLRYFAGLYGVADSRCVEAIRTVELDPGLDRTVGHYSQGMRQRLSLARATLNHPELLLLDEPFSNVDARSAQQMTALLATLRDAGRTILLVTHQPALLESVADEFVRMEGGRITERTRTARGTL